MQEIVLIFHQLPAELQKDIRDVLPSHPACSAPITPAAIEKEDFMHIHESCCSVDTMGVERGADCFSVGVSSKQQAQSFGYFPKP